MHYDLPEHPLNKGAVFIMKNEDRFIEASNYRHNAELVINEISGKFDQAAPVRVWPHHFDTGSLIPVSYNDSGEIIKSIGMGWAMPDNMVNEPYYYLSFWSEEPIEGVEKLESLNLGRWMMPDWNGAILTHSVISNAGTASRQFQLAKTFLNTGIDILLNKINNK